MGASRSCLYKFHQFQLAAAFYPYSNLMVHFIIKYHWLSLMHIPLSRFVYSMPLNWMSYFCNLLFSSSAATLLYAVLTDTYFVLSPRGQRTAPYNVQLYDNWISINAICLMLIRLERNERFIFLCICCWVLKSVGRIWNR